MVKPLRSIPGESLLSPPIPFRQAAFVVLFVAVVQFIIQMSLLTKGMEYAAISLIIDDTYYYLQTAWNAKLLGFVTFDGLHPTNGVQLLWFVIIFILALLAKSKAVLLFSALAVIFLLNALCYLIILRIGAVLKQPVLMLFMASFWALQSLPFRIYSMGMENSLHALIFWAAIWQSTEFLIRLQKQEEPNFRGLTVVLIFFVWTRLDSGLIAVVLFSFCLGMLAFAYRHNLRMLFTRYSKAIAGSIVLAGLGFVAQLTAFLLMGDSLLPVSAMVKTNGISRGLSLEAAVKLVDVVILGMPLILQGRFPALVLILLGLLGILFVVRSGARLPDHQGRLRIFLNLWACLFVGELLYHVYIAVSGVEYIEYFAWYRSPSYIFWLLTASLIALFVMDHLKLSGYSAAIRRWVPIGSSLVIFALATYMFARSVNFTSKLYSARYDAALWIAENSPPDAVFAAWNAGQLGFFSNRTFINLDGVINSVDYYERVLRGPTPLTDYLIENNVDYVVDYSTYDRIPDLPVVHVFPLDDGSGRSIQIWQVTSHFSSSP